MFSTHTHTLVHTNGKQIARLVKWKKIDYLYLVTEHTHACVCVCSEGGGGHTLRRCIEPSQGKYTLTGCCVTLSTPVCVCCLPNNAPQFTAIRHHYFWLGVYLPKSDLLEGGARQVSAACS